MSEDVIGNVREAFSGKRGKILLIGGGIAILGYVAYTRYTGTPEPYPGDDLVPSGSTGARVPQTDPETGNQDGGSTPRRPTSNAAWLSDGVDYLVGRGTPSGPAHSALTKALGGDPITTQEQAWVSQVISALGSPPEGMPPLNVTNGGGNPQSPDKPSPPRLHHVRTTRTTARLEWYAGKGAATYIAYWSGGKEARGITGTSYTFSGLQPGRSYTFSVASVNSAGVRSGSTSNTVTVRTQS